MTDLVKVALIGATPAAMSVLVSWWGSRKNGRKLDDVHDAVNGGLRESKAEVASLKEEIIVLKKIIAGTIDAVPDSDA
jgi:hypothetical protein